VLCVCRDKTRGEKAVSDMRAAVPKATFELLLADVSSLAEVRTLADKVNGRNAALDILVNNAGIMMLPRREETADGFEKQIGTNHLGHFALTGRLLPSLRKSKSPRVTNVSSLMAWTGGFKGDGGLDFTVPEAKYNPTRCYGNSKLANLLFTNELGRRFPDLTVTAAHPGGTNTNLQQHAFNGAFWKLVLQQPAAGATPSLKAATEPGLKSGAYFGPWMGGSCGSPSNFNAIMPPQANDAELCKCFWAASVEATGVQY